MIFKHLAIVLLCCTIFLPPPAPLFPKKKKKKKKKKEVLFHMVSACSDFSTGTSGRNVSTNEAALQ